jgi:hypothetical protein
MEGYSVGYFRDFRKREVTVQDTSGILEYGKLQCRILQGF